MQSQKKSDVVTPETTNVVINTLRLIFLLEIWYPNYMASIDITAKIARISCTFLIGIVINVHLLL